MWIVLTTTSASMIDSTPSPPSFHTTPLYTLQMLFLVAVLGMLSLCCTELP